MASGVFHDKPKTTRGAGGKPSSGFDEGEWDGAAPLGVVKRSGRGSKTAAPGPEHHAAAAKLLKANNRRVGAKTTHPDDIADPQLRDAYAQALQKDAEDYQGERAGRKAKVGAAAGKAGSLVNNGAGYLLGLGAYALVGAYLQGGTPLARQWLAAKFLNRTSGTAGAAATQSGRSGPDAATPAGPDQAYATSPDSTTPPNYNGPGRPR